MLMFLRNAEGSRPSKAVEDPSKRADLPAQESISNQPKMEGTIRIGTTPDIAASASESESSLVLRLLEGDERTMFRALVDKGGDALQKDLIIATKMSDAKASRVLDRLIEKGVITKERHGMTNKVSVRIDR